METTYNATPTDFRDQVQALLLLKAFDTLCAKAKGHCRIVPLKGIDLMRFLYADTLDRELKDIDMLVVPAQRITALMALLQQDGYLPEFPFALDKAALEKKKKVSMLPASEHMPHIDVHLALITKKFFSATINGFNEDAISRLTAVDEVVSVLDPVDRWLFLATHLTFHFLTGDKWYRDLALLLERFDEEQWSVLRQRTVQYHFERVVVPVLLRLQTMYPTIAPQPDILTLLTDRDGQRFLRYVDYMTADPKRLGHGFRLARYYWEFIFISDARQRRQTFLRLLFPSLGNMQNIYRCHALLAVLLYVPHVLMNVLGLLLFQTQYHHVSKAR
ncbi:MAG: nucleotidyltransferase family protein [Bacteroidaceae bacterium]|nr:nucleotidyltransferase family protein [Bacteroidaceae bacterium]